MRTRRWRSAVALAVTALLAMADAAMAAVEDLPVEARTIYNLARFTDWPPEAFAGAAAPMVLCVVGKHEYGAALAMIEGMAAGGRRIAVRQLKSLRGEESCQLVAVAASERARLGRILEAAQAQHALTIAEMDGFLEGGGIINLLRQNDSTFGFEINRHAAETAGLDLSAQLLGLASRVVR